MVATAQPTTQQRTAATCIIVKDGEGMNLEVEFLNMTPVGGEVLVTNKGNAVANATVCVRFEGNPNYIRTLAVRHLNLSPMQSETLTLGVMMPGQIVLEVGELCELNEVARMPSPGNNVVPKK